MFFYAYLLGPEGDVEKCTLLILTSQIVMEAE